MKAKIKNISLVGDEFSSYWPDEEDNFLIGVDMVIGPSGSDGGDIFSVQICSPKWLVKNCTKPIFCRNLIIVDKYDDEEIIKNLERIVGEAERPTWNELANFFARYFHWEFEDYSPNEDFFYAPSFPFGMRLKDGGSSMT